MHRRPLCTYYSSDVSQLLQELQNAYLALPTRCARHTDNQQRPRALQHAAGLCNREQRLVALVVPHGAACDSFHVAAHAYRELNDYCKSSRCRHLTAVLLGTEHRGTARIALSRQAYWVTPLGQVSVDTAAVDYLTQHHHILINEAPHTTEHSIENQLPFLQHAAMHGWDLDAAGCVTPPTADTAAPATSGSPPEAAQLSIVPISIGYLGSQPQLIQQYGAAVADLLQYLQKQQGSGREVVLIATSDFTHAGPWYKEMPPVGVSLEDYMFSQDLPVLQALQQGSVQELLPAAAAKRNSMCGLYPLAVALEALYGASSSDSSNSGSVQPSKPQLLEYKPAHMIYQRPDSTGFAAFVIYQ